MMLTVHGLPSNVKYQELKALIRQKCSITQFILDNLVPEEDGTKKVRIGVADENEGSILMRNLDGFLLNGYRLRVQPVGKAPLLTTPKQANYDSRVNYEHRPEYGQQAMDPHGPNRVLYPAPTTRPASYPYQHAGDVPQQPKVDSGPYPQREVYIHRQQDQSYGYTSKPVPVAAEDRRVVEVRPHILRTVELDRGSVPKPYQPTPQAFAQPQQKPVTIFKDNFQGPTQGYNFNQMNQPMQQSYQGRQDVARSTWAQDQNKQPAYGKPSTPSYDKPVYEDRKFIHHSLAEAPQTRGLLKTPTNYDQPKYSHTSQVTRMSSPRRASSPARRVSPDKRLISPQGRQDLRKVSPNRRLSPRRRISPNRRASPRKSPTGNRRLLSPPQTRVSPSKRQYYEDLEKYSSRPSGPSAPQARFTYEKQTAQNQYSGGYGSSSSQNRAPPPVKSSVPWQGTKPIHPRDSPIERDSIRHAPESKYQSSAKSAYPRYSSAEREIGRHTQENQYRQITKSIYPRDSPTQHGVTKHIPANKYQHFDIPSAKEVHRSAASAPLKRSSRSPVRRIRTPPRRSPRKQSPAHQPWASERQRSPVPRSPPPPPAWGNRPHTEKEQSIVWQRSDEVEQQLDLRRKPGDDWKKEASGFGGIRDKYEDRIDLARRSGDGAPYEKYRKYNDDSRRPPSPQRKDYYSRQEEDRERREFKPKLPDRSEQGTKRHEDYAAGPEVYSKHQGGFTKYPEPFTKRPEPFDEKSHEHSYKRQEMQAGRHRPFSDDRSQFPNRPEPPQNLNLPHHKHQNTFPKRQGLLLKYEEPVPKFQEPRHKYEEPFAKRQEPLLKYTKLAIKHQGSYSRAIEPLARHQERQEPLRARQDQYQIHRDDCYISQENRKHSEGFQYRDANRKHIDSRTGRSADAPLYEANAAAQKPETSFKELTKRAQDWAQGIGNYGSLTAEEEDRETTMDPQLRQKVINLITRKILARHNVKMRDERQKKISIRLRKMIEKRVNNIIGEKSTDLIKIQHKFRTTYTVQDEDKMYFDAVAAYSPARQNEDSGGRSQNVAKEDDRGQMGNAATVKNDQLAKTVSEPIPELKDPTENDVRRELPKEHYKLSPLMEKALRSEIDLLMSKIWKQFPDSPPAEADRIVVDKYKNKSGDDLGYALALNVAQRILNIHHPFSVKVQFSELPRGRTINGFVRKYNVGKFERVGRNRRATAKNTFSGSVGTFRDFDRLCKIRQLEYDGVKVNISSRYMFTKCPPQLKFDKVTKEAIESQSVTKQSKDADQSTSESDSANNSIETKDEIQKEINIVIEFKVEKEGDKKGDDATGKSFETASKLNCDEIVTKPALAQIKKEEELKRENTENKKVDLKPDVDQSEAIKGEANESRKMNKDDTIKNQQIAAGKLNTPKLTQNDLDEKEFEDILKNSIVLDECIASDED